MLRWDQVMKVAAHYEEVRGCQSHRSVVELPREAYHVRQQQPSLSWRVVCVKGIIAAPVHQNTMLAQSSGAKPFGLISTLILSSLTLHRI